MSPRRLVGPDDVPGHPSGAGNAAALHWILRVGVAACFAPQGASEMIAHRAAIQSFAAGGNPEPWAWQLVPVTGVMAIAIAVLTLVRPVPALLLWAAVSETKNPKTLQRFVEDLVKESVKELQKQGLARSLPKS